MSIKPFLYTLLGMTLMIGGVALAAQVSVPSSPGLGYVLTGLANGNYTPQATSSVNFFSLTTTGSSGAATYSSGTLNIPQYSGGSSFGYPFVGDATTTKLDFSGGLQVGALSGFVGGNSGTLYSFASSSADLPNTALQNSSITVNGTTFNLGDSKTITAASSTLLANNNTFSGTNIFNSTITGSVSGNAGTATTLQTGRTIAITGDLAYTSASFDGSGNVTGAGTLATVNTNVGSFTNANITVNGKGLITAASNGTAPVTSVTATYPILSTGGATPVISTAFGTTTTWGMGNNGFVVTGATGIPFTSASSSLNLPNTALQNSSITLNGSAVSLGGSATIASTTLLANNNTFSGINLFTNASSDFSGTWQTFSPSHFQVAGNYLTTYDAFTHPQVGTSATTSGMLFTAASSTFTGNLSITGNSTTTNATSSALAIKNITGCNTTSALTTNATGGVVCGAISGSGTTPGGATTDVQFNDTGSFGGQPSLQYDKTLSTLLIGNSSGLLDDSNLFSNANCGNLAGCAIGGIVFPTRTNGGSGGTSGIQVFNATTSGETGNEIDVFAGFGSTTGPGGGLFLQAGDGGLTSGTGGRVNLTSGAGNGTGDGGGINIKTGRSNGSGVGGDITLSTGTGGHLLFANGGFAAVLNTLGQTAQHTFATPDEDGTITLGTGFTTGDCIKASDSFTVTDAGAPCGSSSGGGLATSSPISAGNLLEYSSAGAGSAFGVATGTVSAGSGISLDNSTRSVIGGSLAISVSGLTTSNFSSANISQWTNNSNYITLGSLSATTPIIYNNSTGAFTWVGLATTSQPSSSNLLTSNGTAGVYGTATSTLTASAPLTGSFTQIGSGGSLGCTTASAGVTGCLSGTDWSTFNGKLSGNQSITLSGVVTGSGATAITTAFGSQTAGVLGNPATGNTAVQATSTLYGAVQNGKLLGGVNGTLQYVATTTAGTGLTYNAGTPGSFSVNTTQSISALSNLTTNALVVTGSGNGTLAAYGGTTCTNQFVRSLSALGAATCATVANTDLSNSTISGVALGSNLNSLSTNSSLTGTSYNGSATVSNWGINLANSNTWTAGQTFNGQINLFTASNALVGIGTSTPFASLSIATTSANAVVVTDGFNTPAFQINTSSTTGSIFTVLATTTSNAQFFGGTGIKLFDIDQYGHETASSTGATPTLSSCGSSPTITAGSNDVTGDVVMGTGSPTACTVTFAHAYATTPEVIMTEYSSTVTAYVSARSTTAFTVTLSAGLSSDAFGYYVIQP